MSIIDIMLFCLVIKQTTSLFDFSKRHKNLKINHTTYFGSDFRIFKHTKIALCQNDILYYSIHKWIVFFK